MKKTEKGFTLVELMIVVAIIGILAAIAIPKFAQMLEKSREGATKGNISAIKSAISIYYGDHEGEWPDDLTEGEVAASGVVGWSFLTSYMDDLPAVKVTGSNENAGALTGTTVNPSTTLTFAAGRVTKYYGVVNATADAVPTATDGRQWAYQVRTGKIWVNSALPDSKNDSYTAYGYQ